LRLWTHRPGPPRLIAPSSQLAADTIDLRGRMVLTDLPAFIREYYQVAEWKHASAILAKDFPNEWRDIIAALSEFRLLRSEVEAPGGGRSRVSKRLDSAFYHREWVEKSFHTRVVIDQAELESPTHQVDCFKNRVAVEIEWNNKTEFYDRDLNNFRLLFDLRAVSVGVIITRCTHLNNKFEKLGPSTTHMDKLLPRLQGGSGGGCPVIVFGISEKLYVDDIAGGHIGQAQPQKLH